MRTTRRMHVIGTLGVCAFSAPFMGLAWIRATTFERSVRRHPWPPVPALKRPLPRTPSEAARRAARVCRALALQVVNEERDALEEWDPAVFELNQEALRRRLMEEDRSGHLRRALALARQSAAEARNPQDVYQAAELLCHVVHDTGDHVAELRYARRLMELAPRDSTSLLLLRRAAACNGLDLLARQVDTTLRQRLTGSDIGQ